MRRSVPFDDLNPGDRIAVFLRYANGTSGFSRGLFQGIVKDARRYWLLVKEENCPIPVLHCTQTVDNVERLRKAKPCPET